MVAEPVTSTLSVSDRLTLLEQEGRRIAALLERVALLEQHVTELRRALMLAQGGV